MNIQTNQSTKFITILLLVTLALAACVPVQAPVADAGSASDSAAANAETVTITHAQGETEVPLNPATVVLFDLSALDTLDQLGVPVAAVPQSSVIPGFLEKYAGEEYANAGTLFEPDYEAVNALEPDLIIVGGRSAAVYADLAEIAPTIDVTVDQANLVESFKAQTTSLGTIFGKAAEVEAALAEIDASIARVQELAAASDATSLIVMTTGGDVTAYGPGSRFGIIHDLLGVTPVVEDIEAATHGDAISFEFILEHDPDLLFVIDRDTAIAAEDAVAAQQVLDNELMHETSAWTNDNIVYLDGAAWYLASTGLGSFATMVGEVEAALQ
jgi:iron complex transport system substrate-binding protein